MHTVKKNDLQTEIMRRALDLYARERLRDQLSDLIGAFSGVEASSFPAPLMIGQFRTFGTFGPAYRVPEPIKKTGPEGRLLRIQVVETGEETEYPYAQALNDPEAI